MGLITNLRGRTFGRLSISPRAEPEIRANRAWWPCTCECGATLVVAAKRLVLPDGQPGCTRSCGCWRADPVLRQARIAAINAMKAQPLVRVRISPPLPKLHDYFLDPLRPAATPKKPKRKISDARKTRFHDFLKGKSYCTNCREHGHSTDDCKATCPDCHGQGRFSRRGCSTCGEYQEPD